MVKKETFDLDSIEIEDVENYRGEPDLKFSHEGLVMEQYRRTLIAASEEMKPGWIERKLDKTGQVLFKIHPDTRKTFAECVKTLKGLLIGDLNKDAREKVNALLEKVEERRQYYISLEKKEWESIPEQVKRFNSNWKDRWIHLEGRMNPDKYYYEFFLEESVELYRKVLEELEKYLWLTEYFQGKKIED